jgi:hypothetical protein
MKSLYALYAEPDDVQRAVDNLRSAGVAESDIIVISSEPIEEYEFSHRDSATWIYWMAGVGGVFGLLFGTWLTRMTELAWPLRTGNMPIVSWWPNMIVIFELTMLGAMLSTVGTLLVTAKLPDAIRPLRPRRRTARFVGVNKLTRDCGDRIRARRRRR